MMRFPFSVIFTVLSIFLLSTLAVPMSRRHTLHKRATGRGTWFYDGLGACGDENSNSDSIVALSAQIYGVGGYCNQYVSITNTANGESAYGLVRDRCQACGPGDLDMSIGLFEQLGDLSTGVLPISWSFMPPGWTP